MALRLLGAHLPQRRGDPHPALFSQSHGFHGLRAAKRALAFRVQGLGSGFRVFGFRVQGLGFGFGVKGLGVRVLGLVARVLDAKRVLGLRA